MSDCIECGKCCSNIQFAIHKPLNKDTRDFYIVRGFDVKVFNRELYIVTVPIVCPHLTKDNKCDIQDDKPVNCKKYPKGLYNKLLVDGCGYKK